MTKFYFLLTYTLFFCFLLPEAPAQTARMEPDTLSFLDAPIAIYLERVKDESFIYEGREYFGFNTRINGHAFFESSEWQEGTIRYKGLIYKNVPMLYDIASEEVVVRHYNRGYRLKLFNDKITHFTILDHYFVKIEEGLSPGFYDLLYNGKVKLLAKRTKIIKEKLEEREIKRDFVQKNRYYIEKGGDYFQVKGRGSVLRVLKDQKPEIRRMLKRNKIKFRRNPEYAIVKMVEFYDQEKDK